jgi:hypothetical protein
MTWSHRNYRTCKISRPFFCVHGYDVAPQELQKVRDMSSFLLRARIHRNYRMCEISRPFFCVREDDVASHEVQRCRISHPFYCLREDDVAS